MNVESGRKISKDNEDHVDNILVALADRVCPIFKEMNYTANGITTLSLIMSIAAIYYLMRRDMTSFTAYYMVAYFFDVMDGYYARKYRIYSDFGDKYDHYKDIVVTSIIILITYDHYEATSYPVALCVMIGLIALMTVYLGCHEKIVDREVGSDILNNLGYMSKEKCVDNMPIIRLFGPGSVQIATILYIWYLSYQHSNKYSIG